MGVNYAGVMGVHTAVVEGVHNVDSFDHVGNAGLEMAVKVCLQWKLDIGYLKNLLQTAEKFARRIAEELGHLIALEVGQINVSPAAIADGNFDYSGASGRDLIFLGLMSGDFLVMLLEK